MKDILSYTDSRKMCCNKGVNYFIRMNDNSSIWNFSKYIVNNFFIHEC